MVERWSIDGVTYCPIKKSEGAFVRHSDYAELEAQLAEVDTHRRKILAENERLLNAFIEKSRILSALEREELFEEMAEAVSREYMHIFGKHLLIKHARLILAAALGVTEEVPEEVIKAQNYLNDAVYSGLSDQEIARRARMLITASQEGK